MIVNTTAPISIENLKLYFTDKSVQYNINYKQSQLQGSKLLTYLSNLDIPSNVDLSECSNDEIYSLLEDYLTSKVIVNVRSLELLTIFILKQYKQIIPLVDKDFIEKNKNILELWVCKLDSLTLYNMDCVSDTFNDFVNQFEKDDTDDATGINFVSLLKHEDTFSLYEVIDKKSLKYYTKYFNDYMFKGKNLYTYWANENNPLFLLTFSIAEGNITSDEYNAAMRTELQQLQEIQK